MVSICFSGDVSFSHIDKYSFDIELDAFFRNSDLAIANLESVITEREKKKHLRLYYLKSKPSISPLLNSFDAFSLANNHVLDYLSDGLADTINTLKTLGKGYFGAGLNRHDAEKPFIYEKNGVKVAILGVTHYVCAGLLNRAGTANMRAARLSKQIRQLKEQGYFVVIMPHWGYEHISYPSPKDRSLARRIIKAGADIIIGSHSHEMQSYEIINGKHVFYSLGNFIFSSKDFIQNDNQYLYESIMVQLKINPDHSYSCDPIPFVTSDTKVALASAEKSEIILKRLDEISKPLLSSDSEFTRLFYQVMFERYLQLKNRKQPSNIEAKVEKKTLWQKYRKYVLYAIYIDWQGIKLMIDAHSRLLTKKNK